MKRTLHHEYNRNRRPTDDSDSLIIKPRINYQKEIETAIQSIEKQMEENWVKSHRHYEWKLASSENRHMELRCTLTTLRVCNYIEKLQNYMFLLSDEVSLFGKYVIYDLARTSPEVALQYNLLQRLRKIELLCNMEKECYGRYYQVIPSTNYNPHIDQIFRKPIAPTLSIGAIR